MQESPTESSTTEAATQPKRVVSEDQREKARERTRRWYAIPENRERQLERLRLNRIAKTDHVQTWHRRWHKANPERVRAHRLRHMYGLELEDYDRMLSAQNGLCAICEGLPAEGKRLVVDHCHDTNKVRGLLCANCNLSLGRFEKWSRDDLFPRFEKYLAEYGA